MPQSALEPLQIRAFEMFNGSFMTEFDEYHTPKAVEDALDKFLVDRQQQVIYARTFATAKLRSCFSKDAVTSNLSKFEAFVEAEKDAARCIWNDIIADEPRDDDELPVKVRLALEQGLLTMRCAIGTSCAGHPEHKRNPKSVSAAQKNVVRALEADNKRRHSTEDDTRVSKEACHCRCCKGGSTEFQLSWDTAIKFLEETDLTTKLKVPLLEEMMQMAGILRAEPGMKNPLHKEITEKRAAIEQLTAQAADDTIPYDSVKPQLAELREQLAQYGGDPTDSFNRFKNGKEFLTVGQVMRQFDRENCKLVAFAKDDRITQKIFYTMGINVGHPTPPSMLAKDLCTSHSCKNFFGQKEALSCDCSDCKEQHNYDGDEGYPTFEYSTREKGAPSFPWAKQHHACIYTVTATNHVTGLCPSDFYHKYVTQLTAHDVPPPGCGARVQRIIILRCLAIMCIGVHQNSM